MSLVLLQYNDSVEVSVCDVAGNLQTFVHHGGLPSTHFHQENISTSKIGTLIKVAEFTGDFTDTSPSFKQQECESKGRLS